MHQYQQNPAKFQRMARGVWLQLSREAQPVSWPASWRSQPTRTKKALGKQKNTIKQKKPKFDTLGQARPDLPWTWPSVSNFGFFCFIVFFCFPKAFLVVVGWLVLQTVCLDLAGLVLVVSWLVLQAVQLTAWSGPAQLTVCCLLLCVDIWWHM